MLGRKKTGMRNAFDEFISTLSTAEKRSDALEDTSVETSQTATFYLEHPRMETVIKDVTHTHDGHTTWRTERNKCLM